MAISGQVNAADVHLGTSAVNYHVMRYGATTTGNKSLLAQVYPALHLSMTFEPFSFLKVAPQFDYTIFGKKSKDQISTKLLAFSIPVVSSVLGGLFDLKFGPGVFWYSISGPAEYPTSWTLPNGTSTADFTLPDRGVTTRVLTLSLGVSKSLGSFKFDFDSIVESAFSKRRAVSLLLSVSYSLFEPSGSFSRGGVGL